MSKHASAIAVFRADYARRDAVLAWQATIDAAAATWPGFVESQVTPDDEAEDDWAASVTFDTEEHLRAWLGSTDREELLQSGRSLGISDSAATIVLVQGESPPPGVGVFVHKVAADRRADFIRVERQLRQASRAFPGFLGSVLLPPGDVRGLWISVTRFETDADLARWLSSPQRATLLVSLREQLAQDFEQYTRSAPFGSIVRFEGAEAQVTPKWRVAMVVLMVLYPTVMLLTRYLSPWLTDLGADPGLGLWLSQVVSTILLTWVLMPLATRIFRRWLDPIDGVGLRVTLIGAGIIVAVYVATLVVFLSVRNLQYWDY